MKIVWFCIPAHGHTNPTLGLVKEMTRAGHEIFYFSFEPFREKIQQAGAQFISCDGYDFEMEDKENGDRVGKDMAFATELLVKSTLALDDMVAEKVDRIGPDLIVSDSMAYWGKLTAMKYGIPYVSSTTTFAFNKESSRYMQQGIGQLFKMLFSMPKIKKQLKKLQEKGYPVKSILEIVSNDNDTNTIVYTSKEFQPCADTFSDKYCFIGPSIRPAGCEMQKTAEKTIYISMGTVVKNKEIYKPELFTAVYACIKSAVVAVTTTLNTLSCQKIAYKWADFSRDRFKCLLWLSRFVKSCHSNCGRKLRIFSSVS